MRMSQRARESTWGYIFISPWIIGAAVLFVWPLVRSAMLSFQQVTNLANLETEWAGLVHYERLVAADVGFIPVLTSTMSDVVVDVPLILIFSLLMALLLARVTRGQTFLRAVFFLPVVIGSAGVLQQLNRFGVGAELTDSTLGPLLKVMGEESQTMGLVGPIETVVDRLSLIVWHTGVEILLFVAGLNSIPESMYEAARVDGATAWESFWKISLPMLSPVILVASVYALVDAFSDPMSSVVRYIMDMGVQRQGKLAYSAALGMVYFVIVFLVLLLVFRISSRLVFYAGEKQ